MELSEPMQQCIKLVEDRNGNSAATYASYIRSYGRWCQEADKDPFQATKLDVERFLNYLYNEEGKGYSSINGTKSALHHFFEAAEDLADADEGVPQPADPEAADEISMSDIVTQKADRQQSKKEKALETNGGRHALPAETVEDIIDAVPAPKMRNSCILEIIYQGMLRREEAALLKIDDIDWHSGEIFIRSEVAKNGYSRKTQIGQSLLSKLKLYRKTDRAASSNANSPHLFISNERENLSADHIGELVAESAKESGHQEVLYTDSMGRERKKISTHSLRHSGAVRRWENGCDLRTIQLALGHQDISVTEQYLDVPDEGVTEKLAESW